MLNANERLTHEHAAGWQTSLTQKEWVRYWSPETKARLIARLGEYEDTGLTPDEILALIARTKPQNS